MTTLEVIGAVFFLILLCIVASALAVVIKRALFDDCGDFTYACMVDEFHMTHDVPKPKEKYTVRGLGQTGCYDYPAASDELENSHDDRYVE